MILTLTLTLEQATAAGLSLCEAEHGVPPQEVAEYCGMAAAFVAKHEGAVRPQQISVAASVSGAAFKKLAKHLTGSRLIVQVGQCAATSAANAGATMHQMAAAASSAVKEAGGTLNR